MLPHGPTAQAEYFKVFWGKWAFILAVVNLIIAEKQYYAMWRGNAVYFWLVSVVAFCVIFIFETWVEDTFWYNQLLYCGRRRDLELMSLLVNRHLAPVRSIGVSVIARCPQGESWL